MNKSTQVFVALLGVLPASVTFACASCGCSINSDWSAQGVSAAGGWNLDLRYDYLNQNKLWSGTKSISATDAAAATNTQTNSPAEVEQYTKNNYLTATLDYNNGGSWGVSLTIPYINRSHSTLGTGSDGVTFDPANGAYTSSASGIGDVRVLGRYSGFTEMHNLGVQLGLKLPTGAKDQNSSGGAVTAVDPGLQLGTGTTDLIVGAYYFDSLSDNWSYFTQASFQAALNHSTMAGGSYKPGNSVSLSLGARYKGFNSFVPSIQVNGRYAQVDSGDAADTYSTGGKLLYLTVGAMVPVTESFAPYVNVQLPIYQNVNGIQLTPKYVASLGVKYSF